MRGDGAQGRNADLRLDLIGVADRPVGLLEDLCDGHAEKQGTQSSQQKQHPLSRLVGDDRELRIGDDLGVRPLRVDIAFLACLLEPAHERREDRALRLDLPVERARGDFGGFHPGDIRLQASQSVAEVPLLAPRNLQFLLERYRDAASLRANGAPDMPKPIADTHCRRVLGSLGGLRLDEALGGVGLLRLERAQERRGGHVTDRQGGRSAVERGPDLGQLRLEGGPDGLRLAELGADVGHLLQQEWRAAG